ncbi:MAG: hypothetical protein K9J37_13665 [Saprospiraceae bacterium]|nr:hypothetical protein [Saprospiraceae bacterium]MCF8250957.1 hypothetical protein [Saprospiraceae bacterium]MCF8281934.1 hypothetical protein [Bacteroidales bacterium]MCF8311921.1 hypothetical protein [Saprospiraceae bacterium]MCF8441929.1 hypothetical protein [Saprospiraceae bacterium]
MSKNSKPHSYHVFLFPFSWDFQAAGEAGISGSFEQRTNLASFENALMETGYWTSLNFAHSPLNYYNDFAYFHTSVREAVFGKPDCKSNIVRNYERPGAKGGLYEIKVKKHAASYRLNIDQIRLNVYDTGVGILSFFLSNNDYQDWQQILEINDFGRRIYPQFLDTASYAEGGDLLHQVHESFLAERIQVLASNGRVIFSEDFKYVENLIGNGGNPSDWSFLSNKLIEGVFGSTLFTTARGMGVARSNISIEPILDDRMFVVCWHGNTKALEDLGQDFLKPEKTDKWMQYMFIDNSGNSCQSDLMAEELLKRHTYHRWAKYGTFYGITRYSLVALSELNDFTQNHLVNHVKGRYMELAQLSLAQRASCQRFSHEINNLASLDEKSMKREADFLHKEYLRFVNKLYFLEATPQEQGIELYEMLQESMKIAKEVDFLNSELTDLYEFLSLREADEQSKAANQFSWVATVFLPASLVAAIFGFSTIDKETNFWQWPSCLSFWLPLLITITAIILAPKLLRRANSRRIVEHSLKK